MIVFYLTTIALASLAIFSISTLSLATTSLKAGAISIFISQSITIFVSFHAPSRFLSASSTPPADDE